MSDERRRRRRDQLGYGEAAIEAGSADFMRNDDQTNVVDVIANIMHYCSDRELDFEAALDTARMHFRDEQGDDDG